MQTQTSEILDLGTQESWVLYDLSDKDRYQSAFFEERGGDTLEVATLWGDHVLSVNTYTKNGLTIGGDEKSDVVLEGIDFQLVCYDLGGYSVQFDARMTGVFQTRDQIMTFQEAIENGSAISTGRHFSLPLDSQTSVRLDLDDMTFLIHLTDVPLPIGNKNSIDKTTIPYIGISGLGHLLLLFLAMMIPDSARAMDLDMFEAEDRFVQILLDPIEEIPEPSNHEGSEESASKYVGDEGQAGDESSKQANKKLAIKGDAEDITLKRARDREIATSAGIASQLMVSSPFGESSETIGNDVIAAIGNLDGYEKGDSFGLNGLGVKGTGRGGDGDERGLGIDDMGTKTATGIGTHGGRRGVGPNKPWERKTRQPKLIPDGRGALMEGGLDRSIIQRIVRQHRRELKYCYEQGLQKNKNLSGTVKLKFIVSAMGTVISARVLSTTLKNRKVESCMTQRVRRWNFPASKGGRPTTVKYPFNLK